MSTKDLQKSLGKKELLAVAIGQIIGAGIMALTGVAIGLTGRSANIAFLLAAVAVILIFLPTVYLTSTIKLRGGTYTQAAVFMGQRFAGVYIIIFIIANISIAMYALSFADYFMALVPGIPSRLIAIILITFIFIVNFFGIGKAAKLQQVMIFILAASLAAFVGFGIFEVQPGYFEQPGFMTNGVVGLLTAMAFLTFATGGATVIVNLSAEAKNPKKDIPFIIILSTLLTAVLYAFMATVAAGVLPIDAVAYQPLTLVAEAILPPWLYVFFVVGGAMFALVTTLNAQVSWITKPIMQACEDGWFSPSLAKLHPKYNTPYRLLIIYYFVGILPVLTGFDIELIANCALLLNYGMYLILGLGLFRLPSLYPEQWKKSPFHIGNGGFYFVNILSILVLSMQICLMFYNLHWSARFGNICVFIIALLFGFLRNSSVKMHVSVED